MGKYGDWYLPSKYELNLLSQQNALIGIFSYPNYRSSKESGIINACTKFYYSSQVLGGKRNYLPGVDAIRAIYTVNPHNRFILRMIGLPWNTNLILKFGISAHILLSRVS